MGALLTFAYVFTRDNGQEPAPGERFARLAARPLELPRNPGPSDECRVQVGAIELPGVRTEGALGPMADREDRVLPVLKRGPVYAVIGGGPPRLMDANPVPSDPWAVQDETLWISRPSYTGPVLVRGGRLDGRSRIRFGGGPEPRLELRLPPGEWDEPGTVRLAGAPVRPREGWRVAARTTRIKASGCHAFQVDGEGFSYVLAFTAVLRGE